MTTKTEAELHLPPRIPPRRNPLECPPRPPGGYRPISPGPTVERGPCHAPAEMSAIEGRAGEALPCVIFGF